MECKPFDFNHACSFLHNEEEMHEECNEKQYSFTTYLLKKFAEGNLIADSVL
jgi:hypothetical protein